MIDFSCKHDIWLEDEDGSLQPMDEPYFRSWRIAPGTWQILSDGDFSYLVEGDEEAILIDSGYGAGNIRTYAQSLTEKPLSKICNTHDHFDHTALNSYFGATNTVNAIYYILIFNTFTKVLFIICTTFINRF